MEMQYDPRVSSMRHVPCDDIMQLTHDSKSHVNGYMQQRWLCLGCGAQIWHGLDAAGIPHTEEEIDE